jgi:deoxyadenosine/deoxycytidine kinase
MNPILFIEANIGGGKSTFAKKMTELKQSRNKELKQASYLDNITVLLEPVDEWVKTVDSDKVNILQHYYSDPNKYSFAFQMNSFISRCHKLMKHRDSEMIHTIIMERSIFSDYYCFAQNCYENGTMTEIEFVIYKKWFHWLTESFSIKSHGFIYIKTDPEECYERIKKRARTAEGIIPLDYLKALHEKHETWLLSLPSDQVLILDGNQDFENDDTIFLEYIEKIKVFFKLKT